LARVEQVSGGDQRVGRVQKQGHDGVGFEPRVVLTHKLASYPPAIRKVLPNTGIGDTSV
jgi:hypothetical protein